MLRCGNASTVCAGAGNRLAMRGVCTRTFRAVGGATLQPRVARGTAQRIEGWRIPMKVPVVRCYSTEGKAEDSALAEEDMEDAPPTVDKSEAEGSNRYKKENPKLLVAKAGTSRSVRQQAADLIRPKMSEKAIREELRWLKDPRQLEHRVLRLLSSHDLASATALVRGAQSQRIECMVAWNHLLKYLLTEEQPVAAFRLYNEMKKRGRMPSPRTYTIMMNGLAKAKKMQGFDPFKTAMSIYKSISAPNSGVRRNIIHTNVMIHVCLHQNAMDSLWQVAGELPEVGPDSLDAFTYTNILRAVATSAKRDLKALDPENPENSRRILERNTQALTEGKRVWSDIMYRWSRGHLKLDRVLVHAMGSLIMEHMTDVEQDCFDVLSLMNQTTGIPIFAVPPPPRPTRQQPPPVEKQENEMQPKEEVEDVPFVDERGRPLREDGEESEQPQEEVEEEEEENFDKLFHSVSREIADGKGPSYIHFGNRELSMILETCLTMEQAAGPAKQYWHFCVNGGNEAYNVQPDSAVCHDYLRVLRRYRTSREVHEIIRDHMVPNRIAEGKTFHIAFSCLRRDTRNVNVFKIANELLALMHESLVLPWTTALIGYLRLIHLLAQNPQFLISLNGIAIDEREHPSNLSVMGQKLQLQLKKLAVKNLRPLLTKLDEPMSKGLSGRLHKNPRAHAARIASAHGTRTSEGLRAMSWTRGLVDEVLGTDLLSLSKEERKELQQYSDLMKKYSDAGLRQTLEKEGALTIPTGEQVMAYEEKLRAARYET